MLRLRNAHRSPLGQRNVLRALYRAQERARTADGLPTFPQLFVHDDRGHLVANSKGAFVPSGIQRKELKRQGMALPDFHAMRHGAAMACDDADEARDLLRHKNTNVTDAVYRRHFTTERREGLRSKLEARHGIETSETEPEATPERHGTPRTLALVAAR
jgi:integrase